jgi:hypothetical protein
LPRAASASSARWTVRWLVPSARDAAIAIECLRDGPLHVVAATDISRRGQYFAERLARPEILDGSRELVLAPGDEREAGALVGELARHHQSEPA